MAELLGLALFVAVVFAFGFKQELNSLKMELQYANGQYNSLREDLRSANDKINSLEKELESAKKYGDELLEDWRREVGASKFD